MTNHYRIKRDHRGVTLERTDGTLVHHLPWELPRLASELMAQPNLDAGHRELLRIYAMGRPTAEYFPVGAEHHNHGDPMCHSRIGYVLPDYANPGAYYLFPQPQAFDGQPHPEPQWKGDYWFQTIRLPMPAGACIIDAQPKRDEPNAVVVRWSRHKGRGSCSAPQQYTWEQAEAGMRRGEIWVATHKHWALELQFAALPGGNWLHSRANERDVWAEYNGSVPLPECEWRPWEAGESTCSCGARVFPQHKHGCPAGGESWSK